MAADADPISPEDCSVFIEIWADVNETTSGELKGIYIVDNRLEEGSTGEGTPELTTVCGRNENVCWSLVPVDPNVTKVGWELSEVGPCPAWGADGQPKRVNATTFTGTARNVVQATPYALAFNVNHETIDATPSMQVRG